MKVINYLVAFSILLGASSGFATSQCEDSALNMVRQHDSYSIYSLRGSEPLRAGEPLLVEGDSWDTHLKTDSEAILINQEIMGVLMDVHVVLVNPDTCQTLTWFKVAPGM
jgi:hypothetical protein